MNIDMTVLLEHLKKKKLSLFFLMSDDDNYRQPKIYGTSYFNQNYPTRTYQIIISTNESLALVDPGGGQEGFNPLPHSWVYLQV